MGRLVCANVLVVIDISSLTYQHREVPALAGARFLPLSRASRSFGQVHRAVISCLKPRVGEDGDVCVAPMCFSKLFGSIAPALETSTYLDVPKLAKTKHPKDALHELTAFGR